ncbi:MAG: Extracellular Matrix protein PelB, partial [Labilithrix sp.]|nr:Extracellular Matrix protein PelB [Labilithrix sp.]
MRRRHFAWAAFSALATSAMVGPPAHAQSKRSDAARTDARSSDEARRPERSTSSPYSNALRIARMLHDDRLVAHLLTMQGMAKGATDADLREVIAAHEAAGSPALAVDFLRRRIGLYPSDRHSRVLLARLLVRGGQSRDAVATWRTFVERFGFEALSFDEACTYALDLSRVGDTDAAYEILRRLKPTAPDDALEYWSALATLAWEHDDSIVALEAYENVYRLEPRTLHAAGRLMALLAEAKRRDDAVRVAMGEHRRTGDPGVVLFAGHLLANDGDWQGLWTVIQEVERAPGALHEHAEYLLLK